MTIGDIQALQQALDARRSPFWYAVHDFADNLCEIPPLINDEGLNDLGEFHDVEVAVGHAATILKDMANAIPSLFRKDILERAIAQMN
jgi:hypothetical protein